MPLSPHPVPGPHGWGHTTQTRAFLSCISCCAGCSGTRTSTSTSPRRSTLHVHTLSENKKIKKNMQVSTVHIGKTRNSFRPLNLASQEAYPNAPRPRSLNNGRRCWHCRLKITGFQERSKGVNNEMWKGTAAAAAATMRKRSSRPSKRAELRQAPCGWP